MTINPQGSFVHLSRFLIAFGVFILSAFLFYLIGAGTIQYAFGVNAGELIVKNAEDFTFNEQLGLKVFQAISASSFIFAAFVITQVYREPFAEYTRLSNPPKFKYLLLIIGMFMMMVPLVNWMVIINGQLSLPQDIAESFKAAEFKSDNLYKAILDLNTGPYFAFNLFLMALLPAVGEELLFRGILMRLFTSWKQNIHWGVIMTALLFAVLHFQPYKFVPMVFIAVTLGYLYYLTGSLWVSIIFHFINNAVVVISDNLIKNGAQSPLLNDDFNFPIYVTLFSAIAFLSLFYLIKKKSNIIPFD